MAQVGYTPIQLYYSSTTTNAPVAGNLAYGELAINITDGKLFYKDNANAIQVIGWKTTPATAGGTGQTSYAVGDLVYADTTTTLAKLADVATGNALISGGVGVAPSYGKIGLTTHVSGTLPVANGGTGLTSTPANGALDIGNGTGFTRTTLTAGTNITITNSAGGISIAAAGGSPGGSTTQLQYNNAGAFGGISGVTTDGTRITASTTIGVGGATPSTSGSGITFPATQSDSSNANTLDDYEEGTWTPAMSASSSGTITMNGTYTSGKYTKVGRLVVCTATMYVGSVSSPTGNLYLDGLPFTVGAPSSSACGWYNGLTSSANNSLIYRVDSSSTSVLIQGFSSGTVAAAAPWVKAATEMNVTVIYFT
jgi:hypothetical protein